MDSKVAPILLSPPPLENQILVLVLELEVDLELEVELEVDLELEVELEVELEAFCLVVFLLESLVMRKVTPPFQYLCFWCQA